MKNDLLLEIGTEEIPARFIPGALVMLKEKTIAAFNEYSIDFADIRTLATPRRLTLLVKGVPAMQKDRTREVYGPPRKAAFDTDGKPTKAAVGFAASQGVEVASLVTRVKDKGEYLVAVIEQKGVAVRDVMAEILRKVILSLTFPKSMRWGDGNLRFVRPIHWILTIFGGETIHFEIDGIRSANITKGHRFLSPGSFVVKEISTYVHLMENSYVIVDQETRRRIITEGITRLAASVGGMPVMDEALLDTVTYLTEYPVPFLCKFPADYLSLPKELLITVMRDHQKFFAIEDERGRLRNHFIVISNTKEENAGTIQAGSERVIKARFEDARFYYEDDLKTSLGARIEDLKRVTFHDRIGSLYEKTEKIVRLASSLSGLFFPEKRAKIERAAWLSKTDLITGVVGEFPELQGLMGKYYALHDGEGKVVADAIVEQYLPAHSGDGLPETDEGSVVSLADKTDNVVSFFAIGLIPTGSEDPFALRRQALAVIAILSEKGYPITLKELFRRAEEGVKEKRPSLSDEVLKFFLQRIEALYASQDYRTDIIQSVLHLVGDLPLSEIKERLVTITKFTGEAAYNSFLLAVKRINNIIPDLPIPGVREELFTEPEEGTLHHEVTKTRAAIEGIIRERKYEDALKALSALTGPVNSFFEAVLVMDKREEVRLNRLALLKEIWDMALMIADFSKLTERI
ncbi:MAG TPA: glycine--tRNA ligase subunit beta [Thermodesulfovibrionales bacterium]|nr:glycine--tRNA ligase subunit beta [Thermodesulfovibrionales bacterium]